MQGYYLDLRLATCADAAPAHVFEYYVQNVYGCLMPCY